MLELDYSKNVLGEKSLDAKMMSRLDFGVIDGEILCCGVVVKGTGVPVLNDRSRGEFYFTEKVAKYILERVKTASCLSVKEIDCDFIGKVCGKEYGFCNKVEFLYSCLDYEYIPGLVRSFEIGFLTPLYFKINVLNKYAQDPAYTLDLFSSTYGAIYNGNEWNIQFGINRNKLVVMWLGDVDKLPIEEQYYLRSENVDSDHKIQSEFYMAQIYVQWSDASIETQCFKKRQSISDLVDGVYGVPLYRLNGEVDSVIANLNRPIFWDEAHVSPVFESFNKIFVESINIKIKGVISKTSPEIDVVDKKGLKLVEAWLSGLGMASAGLVLCPFFVLYDIRNMFCHLGSEFGKRENWKKINQRLGLAENEESWEIIYDRLFTILYASLCGIEIFLESVQRR